MKFFILPLIVCTSLVGCSEPEAIRLENEARSAMKLVLMDPESAKFTDLVGHNNAVCGFVNSKNAMGAYAGNRAFVVRDNDAKIDVPGDVKFMKMFGDSCPPGIALKQMQMATDAVVKNLEETE